MPEAAPHLPFLFSCQQTKQTFPSFSNPFSFSLFPILRWCCFFFFSGGDRSGSLADRVEINAGAFLLFPVSPPLIPFFAVAVMSLLRHFFFIGISDVVTPYGKSRGVPFPKDQAATFPFFSLFTLCPLRTGNQAFLSLNNNTTAFPLYNNLFLRGFF